jgi:putative transposase
MTGFGGVGDQTVGNVCNATLYHPAPERKPTTTWAAFIRTHLALLAGLVSYCPWVTSPGSPILPDERWMQPMARNVTMEELNLNA